MPIVDVTHGPRVSNDHLIRLAADLPHAVSVAVECPEEPYDHDLQPGDVVLRFHPAGPHDAIGLDLVVEVRSGWIRSRAANRQRRVERLCGSVSQLVPELTVGVHLTLPSAAWSQC